MNRYWEEVAKRDGDTREILGSELSVVIRELGIIAVLKIIAEEASRVAQGAGYGAKDSAP